MPESQDEMIASDEAGDELTDADALPDEEEESAEAEIITEEVTYRIGFRLNGEEIEPEGTVTFTVWNLEDEEAEPETVVYSVGDSLEKLTVTLMRKVEATAKKAFQKVYENESIKVVAEYGKAANIPEKAELLVEEVTDSEHFAQREAEFQEEMGNEEATMDMLLKIGFYLDGEEIEPEDTVSITIQFLNDEGIAIGTPITVVHFAEEGTEVLSGSDVDENGATTFVTDSFSEYGISTFAAAGWDYWNKGVPCYISNGTEWVLVSQEKGVPREALIDYGFAKGYDFNAFVDLYESVGYSSESVSVGDRLFGYSTSNGKNGITTMCCKEYAQFNVKWWGSDVSDNDVDWISAIYYLPGNKDLYDNVEIDPSKFSVAKEYQVYLNPGNNNGDKSQFQIQYGDIKRIKLTGSDIQNVHSGVNEEGKSTEFGSVRLLHDSELTSEQRPSGYSFKLVGWYNIADKTYYDVENENEEVYAEVDLSKRNVFYADWVASSYNFRLGEGKDEPGALSTAVNTNDFIKTRVFDFNELFNVYSATYQDISVRDPSIGLVEYEQWSLGSELWYGQWEQNGQGKKLILSPFTLSDGKKSFIFMGAAGADASVGATETGILNKPIGFESSQGNHNEEVLAPGLWNNVLPNDFNTSDDLNKNGLLGSLFSPDSDALGVHYLGEGNYLYSYDKETGVYEYDSDKHGASYQQAENRFYVYENAQRFSDDNGAAFLPFNRFGSTLGTNSTAVNYHFGMSSEISFYLPENFKETTANNPLIFEFTGDDDVWVFLDGKLVLDMGGIHGKKQGTINFTTQTVTVYDPEENPKKIPFSIDETPYNEHKLTIYYMERGSGKSNCKISFNIKPRYLYEEPMASTVKVEKQWPNGHELEEITVELYDVDTNKTIDTVKLGERQEWKWTYIWEGLPKTDSDGNEIKYGVREVDDAGHKLSSYYQVDVSEPDVMGSYDYWVQSKDLKAGEIVILNENSTVALSHDLSAVPSLQENGVIAPSKLPDEIKWTAEQSGEGYLIGFAESGDNGGRKWYLALEAEDQKPKLVSSSEEATIFKWVGTTGDGLCGSGAKENLRLVYRDEAKEFKIANCQAAELADPYHVNIYMLDSVSSKFSSYTISNKFLPNITISKVDAETGDELPESLGAKFTLAQIQGGSETTEEEAKVTEGQRYSYFNGSSWQDTESVFGIDGFIILNKLPDGKYILTEKTPPRDYELPEEPSVTFIVEGAQIKEIVAPEGSTDKQEIAEISKDRLTLTVKNTRIVPKTAQIQFIKVGKGATESNNYELPGASFELYREVDEKDVENGVVPIPKTDVKGVLVKTGTSDEKGVIFEGGACELVYGTYYLVEKDPPRGFIPLAAPIKLVIEENAGNEADKKEEDVKSKPRVYLESDGQVASLRGPEGEETTGIYWIVTVKNTQSIMLPETGSMGTKPFTIGGAMLIISAAAILMYGYSVRRNKSERRSNR